RDEDVTICHFSLERHVDYRPSDYLALFQSAKSVGAIVQCEAVGDVGPHYALLCQVAERLFAALRQLGITPSAFPGAQADKAIALDKGVIGGEGRYFSAGKADDEVSSAPTDRSGCGYREITADRIEHHICAFAAGQFLDLGGKVRVSGVQAVRRSGL